MSTGEDKIRLKIKELEAEYARTQKNKATEGHLGLLKAKMSKLRRELTGKCVECGCHAAAEHLEL